MRANSPLCLAPLDTSPAGGGGKADAGSLLPRSRGRCRQRRRRGGLRWPVATFASAAFYVCAPAHADTLAPIPDFSGVWGRNAFNMETMPSGPGPLTNLRRTGAAGATPIFVGDPVPLVGDYMNPILKPEAAAIVKQKGEYSASGHDFPDPSNQCAAYPPPYLFSIQIGHQMLQLKDEIVIIYTNNMQVRHVRLNSAHPAQLTPTPMGDSIGHYEGNELVIDTVGIKLEPYSMSDRFGTPQSAAMHTVERYRLIDAKDAQNAMERHEKTAGRINAEAGVAPIDTSFDKGLEVDVTVDDPNVFTMPWTAKATYRHMLRDWVETLCAENNTDVLHQGFEHIPTADRPDF